MKTILTSAILFICTYCCFAQSNMCIKANSLSYNFYKNENSNLYKTKLLDNGQLTLEPGIQLSAEIFGSIYTSFKILQTVKNDACSKFSGSTQLLIRYRLFKRWRHSIYAGIGPVIFYRESWTSINNYTDNNFYEHSDPLDYKNFWLSGEIEYNYSINKFGDFSLSLNQINGNSLGVLFGYKYWFSRKPRKNCNCPSY